MTRGRYVLETVFVLAAVVLVMANGLVHHARIDLTESRLHTISQATLDILEPIENTVTITYYLSERLRREYPQPRDVRDLLDEYEVASRGTVNVRVVDPNDLEDPETATALGVVPQQLDVSEDGERRSAIVFSGIVVEYLDRSDSLPFVFSSRTLEYDLTTTIRDLVRDDRRTLAVIIGDPGETLDGDYRRLATEFARRYELREVRAGEPLADDVDVTLVIDAGFLDREQIDPVSDYLDRGGSALFAYDAVGVNIAAGLSPEPLPGDAARELIARFGIVVGRELVLDEIHNEILVEEEAAAFRVQRSYPYPHWPVTIERYTSSSHPTTARFSGLDLYWPTWLELDPEHPGASIIIATSPRAWLMDAPFDLSPRDPEESPGDPEQTTGQYGVVAVAGSDAPGNGRVGVVTDADFLRDRLIEATGSSQNIEYAMNLSDWLSNDEALLEIRTRASRSLALDAIDDPRMETTLEFFAVLVNLALVPGAVVLFGLIRLARRRRRARRGSRGAGREGTR
ncbi:MAG: Gldg family protein [Spirochaetota bacterium]